MMGGSESKELFKMGSDGYAVYRLPALVYHNGIFLAFCEGRMGTEDSSVSEIVMKRGIQQGSDITWTGIQVVAKIDGIRLANPVPLVDKETDTVWVLYKKPGGQDDDDDASLFLIKSTDFGETWSDPRDIRKEIFNQMPKDVEAFTPGPGHGIQMKSGRLVIQGSVWVSDGEGKTDHATVLLSDDHGKTWYPGGYVPLETTDGTIVETNETSAAELADDTLYLNSRTLGKGQPRAQSLSNDGGITFNSPQLVSELIEPDNGSDEPAGCEGCVLNFQPPEQSPQPWVLFSNPASRILRRKMSIRLSKDGSTSWSKPWRIWCLASGYSDMTQYGNESQDGESHKQQNPTFAILYENGWVKSYAQVTFQTFNLADVTGDISGK